MIAPNNLFRLLWSVLFLVSAVQVQSSGNRCPRGMLDKKLCRGQGDQCQSDAECGGESLCCSTGCNRVCTLPGFTACDHSRYFYEKQVKLLKPEESSSVLIPKCTESGAFEEIQCNETSGRCWCVDGFGFEKGGTRANSRAEINCSRRNDRCAGPQCRMLCPYGFELDSDGCEMCFCKDICKGVKCPGSLECQLQEVSCATEPCPPVPTCKKPRTLQSLCPIGVPFTIPENGNPFLCGNRPGQPTCPTGFICNVAAGDDYGICCGSDAFYEKPGLCPTVSSASSLCDESSGEGQCQSSCKHDLECPEMTKCCMTESRGKQCSKALNSTMCLQQRKIAEILSTKEIEGRGYIPQCDSNGHFLLKQCSRNGKICWCVDAAGRNIPQSLAPAEFVHCTTDAAPAQVLRRDLVDGDACDINLCGNTCEFGYQTDEVTGCGTCDCSVDPCSTLNCPTGSKCSFAVPNGCRLGSKSCQMQAICIPNVLHVNPCDNGTPLFDHSSNQLVVCSENRATCPSSHVCVKASVNTDGLCCLNLPRLEPTKPGMCPFISSSICNNGTLESNNKQCSSDNGCEGDMKCCALPCGAICADPLLDAQTESNKLPTMCQYLETVEIKQNDVLKNFKMAMETPKCKSSGDFDEIQCNDQWCFCADEFGMEINSTRVPKAGNNLTSAYCLEERRMPACLDMTCRLGCDYGYTTKDKCRICECVNPCEQNALCDDDHHCEMVDMDCSEGHCPAVPYCIPRVYAAMAMSQQMAKDNGGVCPNGTPYFDAEMNETLTCRPRARMLQCPDDYFCHETKENGDFGHCCPIIELADESSSIIGKGEASIPVISSGNILDDFPVDRTETLTDCELARERQLETVLENQRVNYVPRCHPATGNWELIQCIEEVNMCWCVNTQGVRITGSMTSGKPICNARQSRGGKFLGSTSKSEQAVCSDGESVHVCNKSLCEDRICMAYPDATCGIDPCGGCRVKFYDENNNVVDCGAGLGKCHSKAQRIMNSRAWINQQKQSGDSGDNEFGGSIEHMIEDVLQERLGRAMPAPGSSPFSTVGDLVAEVMKHSESSFEQFGAKVSEFFLRNGSPAEQRGAGKFLAARSLFGSAEFSEPIRTAAATNAFSAAAAMPMIMLKASCPQPPPNEILFRLTGTCIDVCNYDDECGHDERCCLVDCGYRCKKVAIEGQIQVTERSRGVTGLESVRNYDFEESKMLLNPPACRGNGEFESRQSQGDLSWCVDGEGRPQPESFTRGHVICSDQGKIIEKRSSGHICPNTDAQPMICTDQCVNSSCKGHADAICVADPCDSCKVSFFTSSGEKVLCEEKCQQEMDTGFCRAAFVRYFYNVTSKQCEEFFWGGCQGNDNNFDTLDACRDECDREVDICDLRMPTGTCQEKMERWYFDAETDACQEFQGCDDNESNNFPSKRHCESRCPIRVLCPNLVEGGLSVCNRGQACHNVTKDCQGLNMSNYLCIVDPCSCTAELKDLDGQATHCPEVKGADSKPLAETVISSTITEGGLAGRSYETDAEMPLLPAATGDIQVHPSALIVRPEFTRIKSRCASMREKYFSKCDDLGNFLPTQCSVDEPVCWCVDSIGNQLEGTATFLSGSMTCPSVTISRVNVRLSFPVSSAEDVSSSQLGTEVQDLLRSLEAELEDDKVSVENLEGFMNVEFVLEGQSSGHISYMLEEGLRRNLLGISVQDQFTLADLSTSRFHYVVPEDAVGEDERDVTTLPSEESSEVRRVDDEAKVNENFVVGWDDGSVTAKEVNRTDGELNVVAIVLTVIAAVTAVLIIIGLFLGLQNKKKMANYSKNKFSSKPFSSPFAPENKITETKCKI